MLRTAVAGLGVLLLLAAFVAWLAGAFWPVIAYPLVVGLVLLAALAFERWRYRPRVDRGSGRWEDTGERFVDPDSNREMAVFYNPDTGQRDYVESATGDRGSGRLDLPRR